MQDCPPEHMLNWPIIFPKRRQVIFSYVNVNVNATHNKKARTLNLATPGVWRNPALREEIKPTLMREHHNFIFQCYLQSPNFRVERKSSMLICPSGRCHLPMTTANICKIFWTNNGTDRNFISKLTDIFKIILHLQPQKCGWGRKVLPKAFLASTIAAIRQPHRMFN